jgi:hypothetical protein
VRDPIRRVTVVSGLLLGVTMAIVMPFSRSWAADTQASGEVFLLTVDDATLRDLLSTPEFLALTIQGGAALVVMEGSGDVLTDLSDASAGSPENLGGHALGFGSVADDEGNPSPPKLHAAAAELEAMLDASAAETVVAIVVANPPPYLAGEKLTGAIVAQGPPADLARAMGTAPTGSHSTLTSDSTRRVGVVTSADLVESGMAVAGLGEAAFDRGSQIRVVDGPPPVDLYDRYVQSKRLTVPMGTAAAVYAVLASLVAIIALLRSGASRGSRLFGASLAISCPFLALSLLLVGHLPSLTYATVLPFVVATTAIGTLALVPVARRWGTLGAITGAGVILLVALAVEAALGWTAALTPLLGGSQLDGGRFFGFPNAFIGLLLGGSIFVAQRLPRIHGTAVIAAAGLFAGSPWTGSNIGAAVTLFAAAGIWWGFRGGFAWWRTALAAVVSVAAGTIIVVIAHRFLTSAATHITTFSEHTGGVAGMWEKFVDRLGVGADLIAANPFALLPVIGVLLMLVVVLRPPGPVVASFEEAPVWRLALITIVVASIVAYLVNDSGAAAIGEGFTTSISGMLYVSLRRRDDMMMAT